MDFDYQDIYGYDVSLWQDDNRTPQKTNFNKMKQSGAIFCGVKVGQKNYPDPDFEYNWIQSKAANLVRFGYWFCDRYETPKVQAKKYWEILQLDFDSNEMQWADYEVGSWLDWQSLYIFMNEFQMLSGLPNDKFGVYTGYPYWIEHRPVEIYKRQWFANHPLWLAWYTEDYNDVRIPSEWKECLLWQDGTPVIDVGQESPKIDHNKFNGGKEKFERYFGKIPSVVSPPTINFPSSIHIANNIYKIGG